MNTSKPSLFSDLTLAELWRAIKGTLLICTMWGIFIGAGLLLANGGDVGTEATAHVLGYENGKLPTPLIFGVVLIILVIWPGMFSTVVRDLSKSLSLTLTAIADYWAGSSLSRRLWSAVLVFGVALLWSEFPVAAWIATMLTIIFIDQVREVKADRETVA